jgi:hypothetical protein
MFAVVPEITLKEARAATVSPAPLVCMVAEEPPTVRDDKEGASPEAPSACTTNTINPGPPILVLLKV